MIAFTAEYAGGEVRPCDDEIVDAHWFALDALPQLPSPVSIARHLIDATVARLSGTPTGLTSDAQRPGLLASARLATSVRISRHGRFGRRQAMLSIASMTVRVVRYAAAALWPMLLPAAIAQQTPPPPPTSANVVPQRTPGLTPELAAAARLISEGEYATALARRIDAVLATDAKNPQARFLKGVVQADQGETDAAIATFQALNQDYPSCPSRTTTWR